MDTNTALYYREDVDYGIGHTKKPTAAATVGAVGCVRTCTVHTAVHTVHIVRTQQ